uniref:RAB3GAP2_N domain-containing protein n=1 Tax=Heterorhabditis bacteriophora TaxID=37862 RepID=A0A1I7X629_HETBA
MQIYLLIRGLINYKLCGNYLQMEVTITALDRAEGRSCYLLVGYKDNKVQIYEEKGRGTGKLESAWWIETCHGKSEERAVTVLRTRVESTSHTDRLFIHSLAGPEIFIHTVLMEAGKALEAFLVLSTNHALACALSFELLPSRYVKYINNIESFSRFKAMYYRQSGNHQPKNVIISTMFNHQHF